MWPICSYLSVLTDIRQWRVRIVYGASIWRKKKGRSERERQSTHAYFFSFFFVCWLGFFWRVLLELSCTLCSCILGNLAVPFFLCVFFLIHWWWMPVIIAIYSLEMRPRQNIGRERACLGHSTVITDWSRKPPRYVHFQSIWFHNFRGWCDVEKREG